MPKVVDLSMLGSDGFIIQGEAAGDQAGYSVSAAGDVNGDGFDDIIVGAPFNDASDFAGKAYVIFGKASGLRTIDLRNLQAADGFVIQGEDEYYAAGISVSGAGDINGDGFDDIIVTASVYYSGRSTAYVVFGKQSPVSVDLDSLSPSDGFAILGEYKYGYSRFSVSEAGDINGDGFADFIIGDAAANNLTGSAYVIFGKAGGFGSIDLANLALPVGFEIAGGAGDRAGVSVSGAGDVNGDGFDDLIVGAYFGDNGGNNAGQAYVIFGKASGFANMDLASLVPSAGFVIQGDTAEDWAGFSVSAAGDVNGDGFDDLIVGAPLGDDGGNGAGEAYVIFGKASGFGTVDLTNLAAGAGFIIQGDAAGDAAGWSVSAAGDFNDDGFDDLIVGAPSGDDGGIDAGQAYLIFGKASGFGTIDLTNLDPAAGFVIQGDSADDRAGQSVSGAGDVNQDGFADLVVGARMAGGDNAGKAYVIFGVPTGVTLTGTESGETLAGGRGNDFLDGRGGDDILVGNPGNDVLNGGVGNDLLDGGDGIDTAFYAGLFRSYDVALSGAAGTVAGSAEGNDTLTSVETIQFQDGKFVFDVDGVAAQVTRLYDTALNRDPDQVGLDLWVDRIEDQGGSLKQVALGFLNSAEFQAKTGNLSNAEYVDFLYANALGRAPDTAGRTYWVDELASGAKDRADLLIGFSESVEHRGQTAALVGQGFFNTDDSYQAVALLYGTLAGRRPDAAGLTYWAEAIKAGTFSLDQVADGFAASPEFRQLTNGMSNSEVVNFLYQNTLDRPADASGLQYWTGRLEAGMDRGDLLIGFSQSIEHFNLLGAHVTSGIDYYMS